MSNTIINPIVLRDSNIKVAPFTGRYSLSDKIDPSDITRAGHSLEWYRCNCGSRSNLLWVYRNNSNRILACSLHCAAEKAAAHIKLGFIR